MTDTASDLSEAAHGSVRPSSARGLLPALAERRSTRLYDAAHELSDEDLRLLLEAARWAPSAGNSQPWAFVVGRRSDATHQRLVPLLSRGNRSWAPQASALLVTLHRAASGPEPDAPVYSDYAMYDLGQAVAHLNVQAQHMGLWVHQFAGFDHDGVAAELDVPAHWQVTTMAAIGVPLPEELRASVDPSLREREERPRERRPLDDLLFRADG